MKNFARTRIRLALAAVVVAVSAAPAVCHEFWLDASDFSPAPGEEVRVDIRNGERFKGINLAYLDRRITRFDLVVGDRRAPVEARNGDQPAMRLEGKAPALLTLLYEAQPATVGYEAWEKFARFAAHKDFPDVEAEHAARGLPSDGFTEVYSRYSKALIGIGAATGADRAHGLETEFVALANPYADDLSSGLPVRLLYQGAPRADAQIEIFERDGDGAVTITTRRTDAAGEALIPVKPGHDYLLDAVVLREPDATLARENGGAAWETLWAALTFGVPD